MHPKLLNVFLILTSFIGYLEWGTDQHHFLIELEGEILVKLFTEPKSVLHPFVLLPLFGQILLVITLFQKKPGKLMTILGLSGIGLLMLLLFVIGCMGPQFKILVSTLPFIATAFFTIRYYKRYSGEK